MPWNTSPSSRPGLDDRARGFALDPSDPVARRSLAEELRRVGERDAGARLADIIFDADPEELARRWITICDPTRDVASLQEELRMDLAAIDVEKLRANYPSRKDGKPMLNRTVLLKSYPATNGVFPGCRLRLVAATPRSVRWSYAAIRAISITLRMTPNRPLLPEDQWRRPDAPRYEPPGPEAGWHLDREID